MVKIEGKVVGFQKTNCWLLEDSKEKLCALVDPGAEGRKLWNWIREKGLELKLILVTHTHLDHIGGVHYLQRKTGARAIAHELDIKNRWKWFGLSWARFSLVEDGEVLKLGAFEIRVIHTPGHSPGSVSYLIEDNLFSGDLLFYDGIGRWDIPGGSFRALLESLNKKLAGFRDEVKVFPGHGEITSLARERRMNPLFRGGR